MGFWTNDGTRQFVLIEVLYSVARVVYIVDQISIKDSITLIFNVDLTPAPATLSAFEERAVAA